jgi:hypothetical protein
VRAPSSGHPHGLSEATLDELPRDLRRQLVRAEDDGLVKARAIETAAK